MPIYIALIFTIILLISSQAKASEQVCADMFNHTLRKLHSQALVDLCQVTAKKPVLAVNTASHCGFTYQFEGLEALHKKYSERGLVVIGFSSNDFYQEAKTEEAAAKICYVNFGVSFLMLAPTHVKGKKANPVFQAINAQQKAPGWNFTKYLIDPEGKVISRFSSSVKPEDPELNQDIELLLETVEL